MTDQSQISGKFVVNLSLPKPHTTGVKITCESQRSAGVTVTIEEILDGEEDSKDYLQNGFEA